MPTQRPPRRRKLRSSGKGSAKPLPPLYTSLSARLKDIRLLEISPSPDRDSPIRVELRKVRLAEGVCYGTISYAWGDANDKDWDQHKRDSVRGTRLVGSSTPKGAIPGSGARSLH